MTTKSTYVYASSTNALVQQLIDTPLATTAELPELADISAALVSVLKETVAHDTRKALCEKLLQTLGQMRECDTSEPSPELIAQLIEGERFSTSVPACWQEITVQVDYALALTQAVLGGTLPASVESSLTGLLHDMVWMLAEFVKESSGAAQ